MIKVLMFGWEFPPYNSGGLGVACKGLTHALVDEGISLQFILPKKIPIEKSKIEFKFANTFKTLSIQEVQSLIKSPYIVGNHKRFQLGVEEREELYSHDLAMEVYKYAQNAKRIAEETDFDIIHAHDWLSFSAGIAAKEVKDKPLIAHIHATEYDRAGENGNKYILELEQEGFNKADKIIAVSEYTKSILVNRYKIDSSKISVVHNAVDLSEFETKNNSSQHVLLEAKKLGYKVVLSLGRITFQKNLISLLKAAKQILQFHPKTLFVFAGSGDMEVELVETAAKLGISDKVIFTGFLRGNERASILSVSDIFVMPSISEPFGIVPLESLANKTPILVSKQSGVSEIIRSALTVDFWDIDEMTNKIVSVLKNESLKTDLAKDGNLEVHKITWDKAAKKTIKIYHELLNRV